MARSKPSSRTHTARTHTKRRGRRVRKPAQLSLAAQGKRGGYRKNAGRPKGRSAHYIPHITRPKVTRSTPVHVTLKCVDGLPSLRRVRPREIILRVFGEESPRKGFRLIHYSIRKNHIHLVCEGNDSECLSRGIQRVASRVARLLNRLFGRRGRFFADRFHGRVIRAPRDMRNVLSYVLLNHAKDCAKKGIAFHQADSFSSAKYFDGWAHDPHVLEPEAKAPVAEARAWLLRVGWRKHGAIRLDERALRAPP